jgi:membrane associated rhomboid family serine protease
VWGPAGVITSVYVHANTLHLLYNVLALIIFGLLLEDRIGPLRFAIAYYVTGVMGGVGFLMANYDQTFLLVGASGAVSGVFGVFARLYPHQRLSLWFFFPLPPLPVYVLFIGNLVVQFFLAIAGSFTPFGAGVAYVAHIVAAAGGWAIGPLFAPDRHRPTEPAKRQPFPPELAGLGTSWPTWNGRRSPRSGRPGWSASGRGPGVPGAGASSPGPGGTP